MRVLFPLVIVTASVVVACTSATPADDDFDSSSSEIGTCTQIDEEAVEHACLHGGAGPFRNVNASTLAPPDVSREHTSYRVTLEPRASKFGGAVTFVPPESGEFAIYTSSTVPRIRIQGAAGAIAFDCSTPVPTSLCGSLRRLRVIDLKEGAPVTITFTDSMTQKVNLVIEHAEDHDHEGGHEH